MRRLFSSHVITDLLDVMDPQFFHCQLDLTRTLLRLSGINMIALPLGIGLKAAGAQETPNLWIEVFRHRVVVVAMTFHLKHLGIEAVLLQFALGASDQLQGKKRIVSSHPDGQRQFSFGQIQGGIEVLAHGAGMNAGRGKVLRLQHAYVQCEARARGMTEQVHALAVDGIFSPYGLHDLMQKFRAIRSTCRKAGFLLIILYLYYMQLISFLYSVYWLLSV